MKTEVAADSSPRLWGIYHTDREYARVMGDPLRTVIQAASKMEAEREAARLGFDSPWAHPVTESEARRAQWLPLQETQVASASQTVEVPRKRYVQSV